MPVPKILTSILQSFALSESNLTILRSWFRAISPGGDQGNKEDVSKKYDLEYEENVQYHEPVLDYYDDTYRITREDHWYESAVLNDPDRVEEMMKILKDQGRTDIIDDLKATYKKSDILRMLEKPDKGGIIIKGNFSKRFDIFRGYTGDRPENARFNRPGLGEKKAIKWSDMVMYNWKESCKEAGKDIKGLKFMVRGNIVIDETNNVTRATIERVGQKVDGPDDFIDFTRADTEPA
ncbi:hypothetical protein K469DRAFT_685561 [Zopfia rhizophila CBS 207.26]|uniref:Uncharacterized protein n=1 Tax=Zopfia rhizophila CBS 207.26 TaxID=1314779 RepID=A0A6A6EAX4_9PEZI|nr:hypothetical protein K469DRAFT_685561 [Zopfia rhizophila CBS 207.26]